MTLVFSEFGRRVEEKTPQPRNDQRRGSTVFLPESRQIRPDWRGIRVSSKCRTAICEISHRLSEVTRRYGSQNGWLARAAVLARHFGPADVLQSGASRTFPDPA